ncbi:hypothetical protein [Nocardia carnea]|nr:hypothetical protein [Nocardia carnea]
MEDRYVGGRQWAELRCDAVPGLDLGRWLVDRGDLVVFFVEGGIR